MQRGAELGYAFTCRRTNKWSRSFRPNSSRQAACSTRWSTGRGCRRTPSGCSRRAGTTCCSLTSPWSHPSLRPLVPEALTLDLYDGAAWLTISPFCTSHLRPSGVPPLPKLSFFPQVNVRTCVSRERQAGALLFQRGCSQSIGGVVCPGLLPDAVLARGDPGERRDQFGRARAGGEHTIRFRSRRLHGPAALKRSGNARCGVLSRGRSGAGTAGQPGRIPDRTLLRVLVPSRKAVPHRGASSAVAAAAGQRRDLRATAWPNRWA